MGHPLILPLEVPLNPSPDEARQWLTTELDKAEYAVRRNFLADFFQWLTRHLDVGNSPDKVSSLGAWLFVIALVVVLALLARWLHRLNTAEDATAETRRHSSLVEAGVSAAEYRERSRTAMAAGDPDLACVEAYRSVIVDLDSRRVLGDRPARTAQEAARAASQIFVHLSGEIQTAASLFDKALYGQSPAPRTHPQSAARVLALAEQISGTWPDVTPQVTLPANQQVGL